METTLFIGKTVRVAVVEGDRQYFIECIILDFMDDGRTVVVAELDRNGSELNPFTVHDYEVL